MTYLGTIGYRAAYMGQVHEGFMASFVPAWDKLKSTIPGNYYFTRGLGPHGMAANQLAAKFKGDWLLMLDTDHIFSDDAFIEMVETFEEFECDVLVGFTQKRQWPYHPVLYKTDFKLTTVPETIFPGKYELSPIRIDSSGAACLMVRRNVFELLEHWLELKDNLKPFDIIRPDLGEDSSFFMRVKQAGFQAWCAPWIKFHHLETRVVTDDMVDRGDKVPPGFSKFGV